MNVVLHHCAHTHHPPTPNHNKPTYCVIIWLFLHQFRRHVQGCALDGRDHHRVARHGARKPKVTQLDNTTCTNENVLGFHISMDDAVAVEVVEGTDKLLGDMLNNIFGEALIIFQDLKEFSCEKSTG